MRSLLLTIMFIVSLVMPVEAASHCFIGDSRFVGMKNSVEDYGVLWIARVGAGNSWYWSQRDEITGLDRNTIIVYNESTRVCINIRRYSKLRLYESIHGKCYSCGRGSRI